MSEKKLENRGGESEISRQNGGLPGWLWGALGCPGGRKGHRKTPEKHPKSEKIRNTQKTYEKWKSEFDVFIASYNGIGGDEKSEKIKIK